MGKRCFQEEITTQLLKRARTRDQSIRKEINSKYSLEGLMLKLKLQYFGHLMWKANSDTGKDWGQEEKRTAEAEMVREHHRLSDHEFEQTPGDSEGQGSLASCSPWGSQRVRHNWAAEQQQPLEKLRLTDNKWLLHRHWISFTECMNHKKTWAKIHF